MVVTTDAANKDAFLTDLYGKPGKLVVSLECFDYL